ETYTDLVTAPLVLDPDIESLGLKSGARQVSEGVCADVTLNVDLRALAEALDGGRIALRRGLMDDKGRNVQDIHPLTDSPILATIPAEKSDHAVMPMPDLEGHGRNAEAYRELRTNLRYLGMRCRLRSMLVTSSVKGEGKS